MNRRIGAAEWSGSVAARLPRPRMPRAASSRTVQEFGAAPAALICSASPGAGVLSRVQVAVATYRQKTPRQLHKGRSLHAAKLRPVGLKRAGVWRPATCGSPRSCALRSWHLMDMGCCACIQFRQSAPAELRCLLGLTPTAAASSFQAPCSSDARGRWLDVASARRTPQSDCAHKRFASRRRTCRCGPMASRSQASVIRACRRPRARKLTAAVSGCACSARRPFPKLKGRLTRVAARFYKTLCQIATPSLPAQPQICAKKRASSRLLCPSAARAPRSRS